jgi:hypothetical protein
MLIAAGEANQRLARVVNDGGDAVGNLGAFFNTGDPVKWPAIGGTETLPAPSGGLRAAPRTSTTRVGSSAQYLTTPTGAIGPPSGDSAEP